MTRLYHAVMDPHVNPLRRLPPVRRYQIMVLLSVMWSTVFSAVAGLWFFYGAIVLGHVLVLLATLVTGLIFRSARRAELAEGTMSTV